MPTYAVLLQYEVVSALVIEAENEQAAATIASEFEASAHEAVEDSGSVSVSSRVWGDGSIEVQEADDADDAEDLLDDWVDDLDLDDEAGEDEEPATDD